LEVGEADAELEIRILVARLLAHEVVEEAPALHAAAVLHDGDRVLGRRGVAREGQVLLVADGRAGGGERDEEGGEEAHAPLEYRRFEPGGGSCHDGTGTGRSARFLRQAPGRQGDGTVQDLW